MSSYCGRKYPIGTPHFCVLCLLLHTDKKKRSTIIGKNEHNKPDVGVCCCFCCLYFSETARPCHTALGLLGVFTARFQHMHCGCTFYTTLSSEYPSESTTAGVYFPREQHTKQNRQLTIHKHQQTLRYQPYRRSFSYRFPENRKHSVEMMEIWIG